MVLSSPNDPQVVSMEVFDGLISAIDCHGADGTMSLTLKSPAAPDYAVKTWS